MLFSLSIPTSPLPPSLPPLPSSFPSSPLFLPLSTSPSPPLPPSLSPPSPPLSLSLYSDVHKLEDGIGQNFGSFVQECTALFIGFGIALALDYRLALVTSVFLPLLIIMIIVVGKVI